ncbi:MAG: hypothetical protein BECKG1743D_GA0114223_106712 [Candidatus Kentron sp. G]|nr:MAG: hypothetical protein BECKG1743F_GA0114225_105482 [Candidatus Kentron sp. G]VFN02816.1 MAG: hypothetical protein BECKG1743E_GA0114224_105472 [Candidatus Kentron sp. G]VFN05095.1 MAG: hypothetical protein BECKG1743D_GA0114223_106712 [Candidatus Kentron sp. G]
MAHRDLEPAEGPARIPEVRRGQTAIGDKTGENRDHEIQRKKDFVHENLFVERKPERNTAFEASIVTFQASNTALEASIMTLEALSTAFETWNMVFDASNAVIEISNAIFEA